MANQCEVTKGRGLSCKNSLGGITKIYIFNAGVKFTMDADDIITDIQADGGGPATAYQYMLKGTGNNLSETLTSDRNTGTTLFEQVLSITLKKKTAETNKEFKLLAWGNPSIVVEDNVANAWLVGRRFGADLTGGTVVTGDSFSDLAGYTGTFTANELTAANYIKGSMKNEGEPFAEMPTPVTIVKGITNYAEYVLAADCAGTAVPSTFPASTAITNEKVTMSITVTKIGAWSIKSDTVTDTWLEGSGTFDRTGPQSIELNAKTTSGSFGSAGTINLLKVAPVAGTGGTGSCTQSLTVG